MNRLARIVDPEELAKRAGTTARFRVEAPADWGGHEVEVDVASRLVCGACNGGGCDRCGRSGAVRVSSSERALRIHLPRDLGRGVAVRLSDPFDDRSVDLLVVEVVVGDEASATCRRLDPRIPRVERASPWIAVVVAAVLLLVALAIAAGRS